MKTKELIIGKKTVILPGSISKRLEIGNLKIVLFETTDCDPHTPAVCNRNVIAFDSEGNLVWTIEEVEWVNEWKPYSNIWINDQGELMAYGGPGGDYKVNIESGKVEFWRDPKWPPGYKPRPW
jgi:hypothetical protein